MADLPEIRRLMADGERGRDRVVRGGVDVDRHPRRQRVIGALVAPDEAGPVLHRGCCEKAPARLAEKICPPFTASDC